MGSIRTEFKMKKLLAKDNKNRQCVNKQEIQYFILKQISTNSNFLKVIRWNALYNLLSLTKQSSKTILLKRCIKTINSKTFNNLTYFSRTVFLKLIYLGYISGISKSSW